MMNVEVFKGFAKQADGVVTSFTIPSQAENLINTSLNNH